MALVAKRIEIELKAPAGSESRCRVAQEKLPLPDAPGRAVVVSIKARHVRRNEVEGRPGVRQCLERFDLMDNALQPEQGNCFPKDGFSVDVQPKNIMTEASGNVQEVARAATDIQDPQARGRFFEPQIAHALYVRVHPTLQIEIFLRRDAILRIEVSLPDGVEGLAVNRLQERLGIQWIEHPQHRGLRTIVGIAVEELSELVRKAHNGVVQC